jgi:hypothetical protein
MREVVLVPPKAGVPFEIVLDGLESRSGRGVRDPMISKLVDWKTRLKGDQRPC